MINSSSLNDWVPYARGLIAADRQDDDTPGAFTGFGTFSIDPESGGVIDTRGAFNPAFNGRTVKPLFEAETDAFRSALPGLARRAKAGDANAAANYDAMYRALKERKGVYDLAAGTGLNDRNSAYIMNRAFEVASPQIFGTEASAFRNRYARYLSGITKDRDTNAERLVESDGRLDSAFGESFLSALETAGDVFRPSGSLRNVYQNNPGALAAESLHVKEALAAWEKANGFRTDAERETIMAAAARYYAKCKANPGLRALASDPSAIVAAAARAAGSGGTAGGRDVFRDYDDAIATLDRRISYTGSAAEDVARGLGAGEGQQTLAFAAIKDAYQQAYARNLVAGRGADDGGLRDDAELKARLVSNLRRVVPLSTSDAQSREAMLSDFADNVMRQMADTGAVNLSKATMMYHNGALSDVSKYTPPERAVTDGASKALFDASDRIVTRILSNRPWTRAGLFAQQGPSLGYGSPVGNTSGSPYFDPKAIRTAVDEEFDRAVEGSPDLKALAASDPDLVMKVREQYANYVYNATAKADPVSIKYDIDTDGDVTGYREGAKDLLRTLSLGAEARRLGYDLGDWTPKVGDVDEQLRGRGRENFRALYGDLASIVERQIPLDPKTDADIYRAQWGQRLVDSIRKLTDQREPERPKSGIAPLETDVPDFRKTVNSLADGILDAAFSGADAAMGLRYAEAVKRMSAPDPNVSEGQVAALRELSEGIFSDQLNPSLVRNLRAYAANRLGTMAGLSKDARAYYTDAYLPGLVALAKLAFRDSPDGIGLYSSDRIALGRMLDSRSTALFSDAQAQSDWLLQQAALARDEALRRRNEINEESK